MLKGGILELKCRKYVCWNLDPCWYTSIGHNAFIGLEFDSFYSLTEPLGSTQGQQDMPTSMHMGALPALGKGPLALGGMPVMMSFGQGFPAQNLHQQMGELNFSTQVRPLAEIMNTVI